MIQKMRTGVEKARATHSNAFTLVEIMIVVLIISILLAIATPNFVAARESARARACTANLKEIDSAKQQYMMDNKLGSFTDPASSDTTMGGLVSNYVRTYPACPSKGTYDAGTQSILPTCSISSAVASTNSYGTGGKFYHGL